MSKAAVSARLYGLLTGDDDARVCKDIPESACNDQPKNYLLHLLSLIATKVGDELASARLVLPWLITLIGGPASLIALLVPIRESGALLPQLLIAGFVRPYPIRKWFWVAGSLMQGVAVGLMGLAALSLDAKAATWSIVLLLLIFSLARGICSVSQKDVVGKTVSKFRRGRLSGYSAGIAGLITVLVGVYLNQASNYATGTDITPVIGLLLAGAVLWLIAALLFSRLLELPGATEGGKNALSNAISSVSLIRTDSQLRHFVVARALLISTALMVPFIVAVISLSANAGVAELGLLIVASGVAGSLSSPIWGRLSDRSSRLVLIVAGMVTGICGALVSALAVFDIGIHFYFYTLLFMVFVVAHAGVRIGRQTYLVDMATQENRAAYVALSNTIIGIVLLLIGGVSAAAASYGILWAVLFLSILALLGAFSAFRLDEIHQQNT